MNLMNSTANQAMADGPRPKAVMRRFLWTATPLVVLLSVSLAWIYFQDVRHRQALFAGEAASLVALQHEFLTEEFRSVQSDLRYLVCQADLRRFFSGDSAARESLENEYAAYAAAKGVYDQIRLLDNSGQEVIRVNHHGGVSEIVPTDQLQAKADRYYYQHALQLGPDEIYVSPFDLNVEHGKIQQPHKPVIRFLMTVFDSDGQRRGLLAFNYLGAHLLAKMKEIASGFHGEIMLVNQAGEFLMAPNPAEEWGWLLSHKQNFRAKFPKAWHRGRRTTRSQIEAGGDLFTFQFASTSTQNMTSEELDSQLSENTMWIISQIPAHVMTQASRELMGKLLGIHAVTALVIVMLSFVWARSRAMHDLHEQQIAASEGRLRELSKRLLAAQEDERRKLSRELHDELGQQVTAISLNLQMARKALVSSKPAASLQHAADETQSLLRTLHEIASRLRPSVLDDLGLRDAVTSHIAEYERRTGMEVKCDLEFHEDRIPNVVGENIYRILQEALANAAQHSEVKKVAVRLVTSTNEIKLKVEDQGRGFRLAEAEDSPRLGLLGIRERVELLGGTFQLRSSPGQGVCLKVRVPIQRNDGAMANS